MQRKKYANAKDYHKKHHMRPLSETLKREGSCEVCGAVNSSMSLRLCSSHLYMLNDLTAKAIIDYMAVQYLTAQTN